MPRQPGGAYPASEMPDDPRASLVAEGYDAIVDRYLDWAARIRDDPRRAWLARFARRLPAGGSVLDLGCGAGTPTLAALAERFDATGVDISPAQAARARQLVPRARVLVGDMTTIELPPAAFDGVSALYSITHVARDRHAALFARIARWIRPGGRFLAALGARDDPGWTGTWLGVPMFFSSFDAETNRALLDDAGLRIVSHRTHVLREPNDDGTFSDAAFLWVLARRA
jgi:SAM-dependent methyltransferase